MIITKLTIKRSAGYNSDEFVFNSFFNEYNIDLLDATLSGPSDCKKYDIIYTFFSKKMVDYLAELMVDTGIIIHQREDFTAEVIKLFIEGDLDSFKNKFDYVVEFDNIIERMSKEQIVINTILDKIYLSGKDSLTERELSILKNVA